MNVSSGTGSPELSQELALYFTNTVVFIFLRNLVVFTVACNFVTGDLRTVSGTTEFNNKLKFYLFKLDFHILWIIAFTLFLRLIIFFFESLRRLLMKFLIDV